MANIVGNDISEFQSIVDFDTYKNNSNFVIIRATIGTARVDNKFFRNRDESRRVGLPLGFYHYAYPQYNTPEAEADFFCNQLTDIREGEVVVLDFEENWSGNKVDFCKRWLDRVSSKLNGLKPLIYLNQNLITTNDWSPVVNAGYGLWVAAYTYSPTNNNFNKGQWAVAAMQQWTNQQQVPGIIGNVDGDVFFGDVTTFKKYGYKKPVAPPTTDWEAKYNAEVALNATLTQQVSSLQGQLNTANSKITKAKADLA